jgi:hypothetical protein
MKAKGNTREKKNNSSLDNNSKTRKKAEEKGVKQPSEKVLTNRELTIKIHQLESDLREVLEILRYVPQWQGAIIFRDMQRPMSKKKPYGRKPKIHPDHLFQRRDHLTSILEDNWREIEAPLLASKSDKDIRKALKCLLSQRDEIKQTLKFRNLYRLYTEKRLPSVPIMLRHLTPVILV